MHQNYTLLIPLFALVFLSACGVSKSSFEQLQTEKDALQAELIALKSDMRTQNDRLKDLESANTELKMQKQSLTDNISDLEQNMNTTKEKVQEFEFSLRDKQYQINLLWNELDDAFKGVETAVAESNERIKTIEEFLYLDLNDQIAFDPGSDEIDPEDEAQLLKLANMLKQNPSITMMVEGHTDVNQIDKSGNEFKDNWDLSVSRSTQVIRRLEEMGVDPQQLIAAGRSEYMPNPLSGPGDLDSQRRAEFIIVPNVGKLYRLKKEGDNKVVRP